MNLTNTIRYLKQHNFVPSKKMGQNFLINDDIGQKIANSINLHECDCIVEIGPGLGALTQHLVKYGKPIIAVEIDKRLAEFIHKTYPQITLVNDDVLQVN
jgi:16S rRNA (adenine1518-N6/adenine1519-N6)-dimethyltransferase